MMSLRDFTVLQWAADGLPPPNDIEAVTEAVWADLEAEGMDRPAQCIFSIVSLTEDDAGPSVFVTGSQVSMTFLCRYSATTDWS